MTTVERTLVLSGATGGYQEVRPAAGLDRHFQCLWSNTPARDQSIDLAVVPDGCIDLTWIDGELTVAGPDVSVAITPIAPSSTVVGIRFRPGAASIWLGLPMSEIVGSRIPLADFWGKRARAIAARMSDVQSTAERMGVLGAALCQIAPDLDPPHPDIGFVFNALKTESGGRGLSIILDRLDVSPRTLRRRCHEAFGYGPKTLDRILRFQRFLRLVRHAEDARLAGIAFETGYADQAHLTREVRRLSGLSPTQILLQVAGPA
jgi:AraC-like DNA-binding protein